MERLCLQTVLQYRNVRRNSPATMVTRLLLACLVLLGMSDTAWSSFTCSAETCGTTCGMHRAAVKAEPTSCCPKKLVAQSLPDEGQQSGCSCNFKAPPDLAQDDLKLALPITELVAVLPEMRGEPILAVLVIEPREVLFQCDSSPPIVARHPDLGRAPPAA